MVTDTKFDNWFNETQNSLGANNNKLENVKIDIKWDL